MKSLIPLSLMIHSENIEFNRWKTKKLLMKIQNILLEVYINGIIVSKTDIRDDAIFKVKSKCHCLYIPNSKMGKENKNISLNTRML